MLPARGHSSFEDETKKQPAATLLNPRRDVEQLPYLLVECSRQIDCGPFEVGQFESPGPERYVGGRRTMPARKKLSRDASFAVRIEPKTKSEISVGCVGHIETLGLRVAPKSNLFARDRPAQPPNRALNEVVDHSHFNGHNAPRNLRRANGAVRPARPCRAPSG
jgi:hypothetical protein